MLSELAVVICTFERHKSAALAVADVRKQFAGELVVIDQSGPASAAALRAQLPTDVRYIHEPAPNLPAARNVGWSATTAPFILYLDDDVRLFPGCLAAHVAAFANPRVGGVVGRIHERVVVPNAPPGVNRVGRGGRVHTNLAGTVSAPIDALKGANMSIRRAAFADPPFDPNYMGNALLEDADVSESLRHAGWRLWFAADAELVHLSAPSGGVRRSPRDAEHTRFRHTGYFMRKHRGLGALPAALATFSAIACKRALQWRDVSAAAALMNSFRIGWAKASVSR